MDPLKVLWGNNWRKAATSFLAFVAAVAGAVTAIPPAWTAIGLPEVASKRYVHETVDPVRIAQMEAQEKLNKAVNRLYRSQLELYKSQIGEALFRAQHDPTITTSETAQEHVRELQEKLSEATSRLNAQHND